MSDAPRRSPRVRIAGSAVATGKGDDGTTGLLYGGRIAKDDARAEAYGTIDEAVACLGLARAELGVLESSGRLPHALQDLGETLLSLQRDLFVAGAELATNPDAWDRLRDGETRVDEAMLSALEDRLRVGGGCRADAPRVHRAGRQPPLGGARDEPDRGAPRRAARHRP